MISDKDLPELESYRRLEQNLPMETAPSLGSLVVSGANENLPIHRWFKYKEAYSAQLLHRILPYAEGEATSGLVLLDPYCGVGTSLLSAQLNPGFISFATGIERNPFVAFVARTKLGWPTIETKELERIGIAVLAAANETSPTLPELSSIRTGRCISRHIAGRLLSIRDAILDFPESTTRDALLVGLAAAIEPLSRVRKDGRALRLVDRSHQHVVPLLRQKWVEIQLDVSRMQAAYRNLVKTRVQEGDGRTLGAAGIEINSIDLVLTSPPYPNNIDYSEVYKLELWLLGFVNSSSQFLRLRKSTLRSHPTSDLATKPEPDFSAAIAREPLVHFFEPIVKRTAAYEGTWRNRLLHSLSD